MSNETKEKTTAEIAAENLATINEAGAVTAEEMAHVAATLETAPAKKSGKGKTQPEPELVAKLKAARAKAKAETDALTAVGKAACRRHSLPAVWVTADGQCFKQENDARKHGKSLGFSAVPLKVEA